MRFEFLRFFLILIFTNYKKIYFIFIFIINFSELLLGRSRRSREDSKDEHISYNLRRTVRTVRYVSVSYCMSTFSSHHHHHQGCTVKNLIIVSSHVMNTF